jgi:hypothetical protein
MKIDKVMTGKRDGEVRCLACFARFWPKRGSDRATCEGACLGEISQTGLR